MELLESAFKQGFAPAIVVAIYLVIIKIIDSKKETVQTKLSNQLAQSINIISSYLNDVTKNIIDKDKDKCKIAIEDAIFSSGLRLTNFVSTTIINNHIDKNKENILGNIHNIVNSEFYSVFSTLAMYKIDDVRVSDYLDKKWMEDIEKDIINIIYNQNLGKEDKILAFSNKIIFKFQSYVTYIINHAIK